MTKRKKVEREHYVNNKDFYEALVVYFREKSLNESTRIPEYIGDCFLRIATRLSSKYNFGGYAFRDDMIMEGAANCVKCIANFDTKYTNPFAYFTEVAYRAFVRKIQSEKKQLYIKCVSLRDVLMECEENTIPKQTNYYTQVSDEFIEQYEESKKSKKKAKKSPVLVIDEFLVELEPEKVK